MNDMRLGLLALGIIVIVAVWLYNKFQERRVRRQMETPFTQRAPDVLLGERQGAPASERAEPRFVVGEDSGTSAASGSAPAGDAEEPAAELDEEISAVFLILPEQPVSGERARSLFQTVRHAGRQHVKVFGRGHGAWRLLAPGDRYESIAVSVQLANRSGPLNEIEYSELVARLTHIAEQLGATCEVPDMAETIGRARALDARCAPLDRQIGITLAHPQGQWPATRIAAAVERGGLVLRADGRFHALTPSGTPLYVVQNGDGPAFRVDNLPTLSSGRLVCLLDVPLAPRAAQPYAQMTAFAQNLARELDAVLVDDQLRSLTPATLEAIGAQIEPVYAELEVAGMPAGSSRARALFS